MTKPRVSILLPSYQAEATLEACLRSIQRQTFQDWECLVLDDGSTDATAAIASLYRYRDPRFQIISRPHLGLVEVLNEGIGRCSAEFVARMDADDLMHSDRLSAQVEALETQPMLSAVGCHVRLFPRTHLRAGWRNYERWINSMRTPEEVERDALIESPIVHPGMMIRREVLAANGYRECPWPEDYDLILRLLAGGHRIGVVPRRLLAWRNDPQQRTQTSPTCSIERFPLCKAAFLAEGFLRNHTSFGLWGYGKTGRVLHGALREHGKKLAYLIDLHPGRLGNRIQGANVIHPSEFPSSSEFPLIVSVARNKPRREIRQFLQDRNLVELRDFVCAA